MKGLVYKQSNSLISLTGNAYTNPQNYGTARMCVKKGSDTVKFGLTTNTSASQYCGIRMKLNGNTAYIGRIDNYTSMITTTSSTSSSWNTSSTREEEKRVDYQDYSTSSWSGTEEHWYQTNTQLQSQGTSKYEYETTVEKGTAVTSPYSRTVSVTVTNYEYNIKYYSTTDYVNYDILKTTIATGNINSYTATSGGSPGWSYSTLTRLISTSENGNYDENMSSYWTCTYSTIGFYTYSKNNILNTYFTFTESDVRSNSIQTLTASKASINLLGSYLALSSGYILSSFRPYIPSALSLSTYITELYSSKTVKLTFTDSQVGKTKTKGNWYDVSTVKNNTYTATRNACGPYTAVSAGVKVTLTEKVTSSEERVTISEWTTTTSVSSESKYNSTSTSTWNTYSFETKTITDYYITSSASTNPNYQYRTTLTSHNYNI